MGNIADLKRKEKLRSRKVAVERESRQFKNTQFAKLTASANDNITDVSNMPAWLVPDAEDGVLSTIPVAFKKTPPPSASKRPFTKPVFMSEKDAEYVAAFAKARDKAKDKASAQSKKLKDADLDKYGLASEDENAAADYRLEFGYRRIVDILLAGVVVGPVFEKGLRSDTWGINFQLFAWGTPRGGAIKAAYNKEDGFQVYMRKVLALDCPFVQANTEILTMIRIDTDMAWDSPDDLFSVLQNLVDEGKLPCMPHLATGLLTEDGQFLRPHLIFYLRDPVLNMPSVKGFRIGPVMLYDAVYFGLLDALVEVGCDTEAPAKSMITKCPLSPEWHAVSLNEHTYPTLREYAAGLDLSKPREITHREAAAFKSNLGIEHSNVIFNELKDEAFSFVTQLHFNASGEARAKFKGDDKQKLQDLIQDHLLRVAEDMVIVDGRGRKKKTKVHKLAGMILGIAKWTAEKFDHRKAHTNQMSTGKLRHLTHACKSSTEAKSIGGAYSGQLKSDRSLERLLGIYNAMQVAGVEITKKGFVRFAAEKGETVSLTTVKARWNEIVTALGAVVSNQTGGSSSSIVKMGPRHTVGVEASDSEQKGLNSAPTPTCAALQEETDQPLAETHGGSQPETANQQNLTASVITVELTVAGYDSLEDHDQEEIGVGYGWTGDEDTVLSSSDDDLTDFEFDHYNEEDL